MLNQILKYFLENKIITVLILIGFIGWGIVTAPFGWDIGILPSDPVPVDAIPDIGENQQIIFTEWQGKSPQDIEDQISYPLTTYLLGIPGVKSVRSTSMFGFSSIYVIFEDKMEFYWTRTRILEKLSSLPRGLLPEGVQPALGPDATALGQVFWYTLEGRDKDGNPTGGWDLHEIRTVQDFYVKYGLNAVAGVSEVASIGGFVKEYQIDVNPSALKAYNISLDKVMRAVQMSNKDVGAETIEINQVEYLIRGIGYIKKIEDVESAVVVVQDNVPIRIKDIAVVKLGPATRRGILDKGGTEVVGGVVVARHGANPLQVINGVKEKIKELSVGLPSKILNNGKESQLTIVPFYDRSGLIHETLGTLEESLALEILICILVVIVMVQNLRVSLIISSLLPIATLMTFIAMRYLGVDANIVALSGIAIAIGTMVDLGIILSENVVKHLQEAPKNQKLITTIYKGAAEVSSAILTGVATTIVSFLPVFSLEAAEGKLFSPLAFTKSFALIASLIIALFILPTFAHWFLGFNIKSRRIRKYGNMFLMLVGVSALFLAYNWAGVMLLLFGALPFVQSYIQDKNVRIHSYLNYILHHAALIITIVGVVWLLAEYWMPLGASRSLLLNFIFVIISVGLVLLIFVLLEAYYRPLLTWCIANKFKFLLIPTTLVFLGINIWIGFDTLFGFVAKGFNEVGWNVRSTSVWSKMAHTFPGMGKEFMPPLDEGSFLLMPTAMPHSGIEYNKKVVGQLDMLLSKIPEVELVVGKVGRAETAIDPAPIFMYENIINYKPEYILNAKGHRERFKVNDTGAFVTVSGKVFSNEAGLSQQLTAADLIVDENGRYYRNWRKHIQSSNDIWEEIVTVSKIPGVTSAPKLQPIATRLVMLQTGMRAPMGIKVFGSDLKTIEQVGIALEKILKEVPSVKAEAVFADRIVGKPYLHLNINRNTIARFGLTIDDVQQTIETAIGGNRITTTVEGRERFSVRIRYPREWRNDAFALENTLITTSTGAQVPIAQMVDVEYVQGPQEIKSEGTFLVGYVLFDKKEGYAEITTVNDARDAIEEKIASGELKLPKGVSFKFSGSYENQVRAEKRLTIIIPLVLLIVFLILYFQFRSVLTSAMVFTAIAIAFSGGFIMIWLWGQPWFMNFQFLGVNMRDLFQMHNINLSVAIWVGFIALFGIATDDGVLMATYLDQSLTTSRFTTLKELRMAIVDGGKRRIKPSAMTTATTIIALLPVFTSTGRGSDIMIPMAIPAFGGMIIDVTSYFIVPVLYAIREERKFKQSTL